MFLKQEDSEPLLNNEEQPKKNSEESSQEFNLDSPYQKLSDENRYNELTPSDQNAYQQFSPDYELPYERVIPQINAYSENNRNEPTQLL
jgi:hypothetical protein